MPQWAFQFDCIDPTLILDGAGSFDYREIAGTPSGVGVVGIFHGAQEPTLNLVSGVSNVAAMSIQDARAIISSRQGVV